MRVPVSHSFPGTLLFRLALAGLALASLLIHSCLNDNHNTNITGDQDLAGGAATLDARGSTVDSEVYLGQRAVDEGNAGSGGDIRIISGGTLQMNSNAVTFDTDTMISGLTLTGAGGMTVHSDRSYTFSGAYVYNFLWIQPGGEIILRDNTNIRVLGDVYVGGAIRSVADEGIIRRDGNNCSIIANGSMVITGSVICSGQNQPNLPAYSQPGDSTLREKDIFAGNGGQIYLQSGVSATGYQTISFGGAARQMSMVITGDIFADGGGSDSLDRRLGGAGAGGEILLGTQFDLYFAGRAGARAGNSRTNNFQVGPVGGRIEIVSTGDLFMERIARINVSGGVSSNLLGGDAGTLKIEAPIGDATLDGFEVLAEGGAVNYYSDSVAGDGGTVALSGDNLTISNMRISAVGGDAIEDAIGNGGTGGTVTFSCLDTTVVAADVQIDVQGGDCQGRDKNAGTGGDFAAIVSNGLAGVTFNGYLSTLGGSDFGGLQGVTGSACVSFADSVQSLYNIMGLNETIDDYPMAGCLVDKIEEFTATVHSIDVDDATIMPDSIIATVPPVVGYDFYRVYYNGDATVTITLSGDSSGLDLYAGPAAVLGSTNTGDYTESSTDSTSTESITYTTGGGSGFISVLITEGVTVAEEYTISASGSGP